MILDLHRQGLSLSAIARQTGLDRKTVRRYMSVVLNHRPIVPGHPALARSRRLMPTFGSVWWPIQR